MEPMLLFLFSLLLLVSVVSSYYAVKFGLVILRLEDIIEASLDSLDDRYQNLASIASKPVFFDSLEVRACIQEIKKSRDTIQLIALQLTSISNNSINNEEGKIEQFSKSRKEETKNSQEDKEAFEQKTIFRPKDR
jgi:hypothetical protein